MGNMNLSPEKMDSLLKIAGQKLGRDPAELKTQLENGNMEQMLGKLDPKTQTQITSLMNNPKALETLLGNEKIRNMVAGFMGGQK